MGLLPSACNGQLQDAEEYLDRQTHVTCHAYAYVEST